MTKRHYIHLIHRYWVFFENLLCYGYAMDRIPGMSVYPFDQWSAGRPEWQDPNNVIILWLWSSPGMIDVIPKERKASLAVWYIESVGPPEGLCPDQRPVLERFLGYFKVPELVIVGFPSSAEFLKPYCRKVIYAPTGYDPAVMGTPNWSAPKKYDFAFCGLEAGRRNWIFPALRKRFGTRFIHITGKFGLDRKSIYDQCRVVLYIAHSVEPCFAPMRIWQSIASSAALVTEKRDVWPAVAGRHYIEVPEAKETELDQFIDRIERTLDQPLEEIARRAHEELSVYTVDRAMEYIAAAL